MLPSTATSSSYPLPARRTAYDADTYTDSRPTAVSAPTLTPLRPIIPSRTSGVILTLHPVPLAPRPTLSTTTVTSDDIVLPPLDRPDLPGTGVSLPAISSLTDLASVRNEVMHTDTRAVQDNVKRLPSPQSVKVESKGKDVPVTPPAKPADTRAMPFTPVSSWKPTTRTTASTDTGPARSRTVKQSVAARRPGLPTPVTGKRKLFVVGDGVEDEAVGRDMNKPGSLTTTTPLPARRPIPPATAPATGWSAPFTNRPLLLPLPIGPPAFRYPAPVPAPYSAPIVGSYPYPSMHHQGHQATRTSSAAMDRARTEAIEQARARAYARLPVYGAMQAFDPHPGPYLPQTRLPAPPVLINGPVFGRTPLHALPARPAYELRSVPVLPARPVQTARPRTPPSPEPSSPTGQAGTPDVEVDQLSGRFSRTVSAESLHAVGEEDEDEEDRHLSVQDVAGRAAYAKSLGAQDPRPLGAKHRICSRYMHRRFGRWVKTLGPGEKKLKYPGGRDGFLADMRTEARAAGEWDEGWLDPFGMWSLYGGNFCVDYPELVKVQSLRA